MGLGKHIVEHEILGVADISARLAVLEGQDEIYEIYESINAGAGAAAIPVNATVLLNRYPAAGDALITQLDGNGRPIDEPARTAGGVVITTTFDAGGNWVLSGVPTAYPVALIYQVSIDRQYASNISIAQIVDKFELYEADEIVYDNSGSGLTSNDVQGAIDELNTVVGGAGYYSMKNSVLVNPDVAEVTGKRYQSIASALAYIATQTPGQINRWSVVVSGHNTENFAIPAYVAIVGIGEAATLWGTITSAGISGDWRQYLIYNCTVSNVNPGASQQIACVNTHIINSTVANGRLRLYNCYIEDCDWSGANEVFAFSCVFRSGSAANINAADGQFHNCYFDLYLDISQGDFYNCRFANSIDLEPSGNLNLYNCRCDMVNRFFVNAGTTYVENCTVRDVDVDNGTITFKQSTIEDLDMSGGTVNVYNSIMASLTNTGGTLNVYGFFFDNSTNILTADEAQAAIEELAGIAVRRFTTVANAEAANGTDNDLCYVVETETLYRYESAGAAYTDDNMYVLSTADAGNTRWLGVAGQYAILQPRVLATYARLGAEEIDGVGNAIDTNISLYQVPASTYAESVKVTICNRNNSVVAVRLAHVDGAIGAVADEDYILYDAELESYETRTIVIGGMVATDSILIRSDTVDVNFVATGKTYAADGGWRRLGATTVVADTDTALYTATGYVEKVSIVACNKDGVNAVNVRIALIDGAIGAWADEDNLVYEDPLLAGETKVYDFEIDMANSNTIGVRSDDADVNFIAYGRVAV